MTPKEKLNFILETIPHSQKQIAEILGINETNISQWKNKEALKRYQYLALESAFSIPIEIFENKNIDSKEKILSLLQKFKQPESIPSDTIDKKTLKLLNGKWYLYGYFSVFEKIYEDILLIKNKEIIHFNHKGDMDYKGKVLESNAFYTSLLLQKKSDVTYIVLNNRSMDKELFYGIVITKSSFFHQDFMQLILLSKNKIELNSSKKILGNKEITQLHIKREFIEKIAHFNNNKKLEFQKYSNEDFLEYLASKGTIYLYFNTNSPNKHTLEISANNIIKFYRNNKLYLTGKIKFFQDEILMDFEDGSKEKTYLMVEKLYKKIIPFAFKGALYTTDEKVIGMGLMSEEELPPEVIESFLGKPQHNILNITQLKHKLYLSLEDLI